MSKDELRRWLEQHPGPEWEEERNRIIEENQEAADQLLNDVVDVIRQSLLSLVNEIMLDDRYHPT